MHHLLEQLLADSPVLADGAWGTQLQAVGLPSGDCPDQWNLSHPEHVEKVARAYVEAGSRVILTNTFRANGLALADSNLVDKVEAVNQAGAEISLRAANGRASVFGSIGPSGKMLFAGQVSEEDLHNAFAEQVRALATAGVDGLVIETMSDLDEAKIALVAAQSSGLPVVACMVFDSGKQSERTMTGATAEQVARELTAAGADVIGANCGQGIASYVQICRQLRSVTDRPIWIKANAGVPQMDGDQIVYQTTAEEFAEHGLRLVEAGAKFLGGCCGTGPDYIRVLKEKLARDSGRDS